jgi:hypothetical protein
MGAIPDTVSRARMDLARSGMLAFGKYESGQPSQSCTSLIALNSAERERSVAGWMANVSRSQIDTQAIKTHRKENGSSAATSLF